MLPQTAAFPSVAPTASTAVPVMEPLEVRRLFRDVAILMPPGIINGTESSEEITVRARPGQDGQPPQLVVTVGGVETVHPVEDVLTVAVRAGGGDDTVSVDLSGGGPSLRVGRVHIDGGAGNDTLRGSSSMDLLQGGPGNDTLEGGDNVDFLYGGRGNDVLVAGDGRNRSLYRERVRGGGGRDTFSALDRRSSWVDFGPGDRVLRQRSAGAVASVSAGVLGAADMAAGNEDEDCNPDDLLGRVEPPPEINSFICPAPFME